MSKLLVAALVGVLTLIGAVVAFAAPTSQTTADAQFTTGRAQAGTPGNPAPNSFTVRLTMDTTTGTDQPETVDVINLQTPRQVKINSERYPRRARCDIRRVKQAGSDSSCPRAARAGSGVVNLEAGGGTIKEVADLRAWVARTGDVFIFLDSRPGQPVELNAAVLCQIVRQSLARCVIPEALQRPAGVKSTIERLRLTLRGRTRARGRTINLITTTGCRRRAWVFGIRLAMDDGGTIRDSDRVPCRR